MRWALLAAVLASLVPATAAACSCAPLDMRLRSNLANEQAVIFVGTVEGEATRGAGFFTLERLLRVRPHLFLRGSWPARPLEVWGGSLDGSGDCGAPLEEGWSYLVFATRADDGKLAASRCGLTAPLLGLGVSFGVLALLLLGVSVVMRRLWRLLRRRLEVRTEPTRARRGSPFVWLAVSAALMATVVLLWSLTTRLPSRVGVAVCNKMAAEPIDGVAAQWTPDVRSQVPIQRGTLQPAECRWDYLPFERGASLSVTYRYQGTVFTVRDPVLTQVAGGDRTYTKVLAPGRTESGIDFPETNPLLVVVYLGILGCVSGALLALCCAAWAAVRAHLRARPQGG